MQRALDRLARERGSRYWAGREFHEAERRLIARHRENPWYISTLSAETKVTPEAPPSGPP